MIDIIIVNYKSTDLLLKCLESIYDALGDLSANVFVEDNGSDDDLERVDQLFPTVKVTRNENNLGFSAAANRGLERTDAPYAVLLNPDSVVRKDFFEPILGYMENNPDVGVLGPKILDHDGGVQGSARSFPNPLTGLFGRASLLSRLFPNNRFTRGNILTDRKDSIIPMEVDWVSGACMMVRREALREVGLLDERFFMYWEDADWCRRMWQKDWRVVYFPGAMVVHHVGGSSGKRPLRSLIEFHKSSYWLFTKHSDPPLRLLAPMVLATLFVRLVFSICLNRLERISKKILALGRGGNWSSVPTERQKLKVFRIITRLNIGGPAIHVQLLTRGLNRAKFHSILLAGNIGAGEGDMEYLFEGLVEKPVIIPELQREGSPFVDLKALFKILVTLVRERPDILHTHTAKAGFTGRIAAFLYNLIFQKHVRVVHTFHGNVFEGYFGRAKSWLFVRIERVLGWLTDVIIAVSDTQKEELGQKYCIAPPKKIRTIELGFNLRPFLKNQKYRGRFRQVFGISNRSLLIGTVGRLAPIKNHRMFLEAAKILAEQNTKVPVNFVIVGDGESRKALEAYSTKLGLSQLVHFSGWIRDVPPVYADLDILALSSLNEGTPVSIIEAMASSVPVIATDAGGVLDLLGKPDKIPRTGDFLQCERGILCRRNDPRGLARGFKFLIELDDREKERLKDRARIFVEQRFSEKRLLQDVETLYLDLMERREITEHGAILKGAQA